MEDSDSHIGTVSVTQADTFHGWIPCSIKLLVESCSSNSLEVVSVSKVDISFQLLVYV